MRSVTKRLVHVCAKMAMEDRDAISVYQATTTIRIVCHVIAVRRAVFRPFVMHPESVHA